MKMKVIQLRNNLEKYFFYIHQIKIVLRGFTAISSNKMKYVYDLRQTRDFLMI